MSHLEFSYNEFLALLLLYISQSDAAMDDSEKLLVKKKIGKTTFHHIIPVFESMSDNEILQTITDYKGVYFPTVDQKKEILKEISTIFYSDDEFSAMEQAIFKMLERII